MNLGEKTILGECDPGFEGACEKSEEKYQQWKNYTTSIIYKLNNPCYIDDM